MSHTDLKTELAAQAATVEPLLPIEKKLIAGSLITGVALLLVLLAINHFYPLAA